MSTEFRFPDESFACIRWAKGAATHGMGMECGNPDRAMAVGEFLQADPGHHLEGDDGSWLFWDHAEGASPELGFKDYDWTFGEFGGTAEVGTGEYFDRSQDMGTFGSRRRRAAARAAATSQKPTEANAEASRTLAAVDIEDVAEWCPVCDSENELEWNSGSPRCLVCDAVWMNAEELGFDQFDARLKEPAVAQTKTAIAECPECGSTDVRERPDGEYVCKACSHVFEGSRKAAGLTPMEYDWYVEPDEEPGELILIICDPDTDEIFDTMGGIDVEHAISDHGNVNYNADSDRYLSELAQQMADSYVKTGSRKTAKAFCWDCDKEVADGESGQPCPDCGEPMSPVSKADADGPDDHKDARCAGSEEWHPSPGRTASMTTCSSCGWQIWPTYWRPRLGGYLPPHTSTIDGKAAVRKTASSGFFVDPPLPVDEFKSVMQAGGLTVTNGDRPTDLLTEAPDGFVHWNVYEGTVNYGERFGGNSADTACDVLYNAGYDIVWEGDEGFDELMNS